jgi:hypothetical protein
MADVLDSRWTECPHCPAVVAWHEYTEHFRWHAERSRTGEIDLLPSSAKRAVRSALDRLSDGRDTHFTECVRCPGVLVPIDQLAEHLHWHNTA